MKLDLTSLKKAHHQLQKSLEYLSSDLAKKDPELARQLRSAAIQSFEYTYELSAKMIRRQLTQIAEVPQSVQEMTYADLMRSAASAGLIHEVKHFLEYRDKRNKTSHTYDEAPAEDVLSVLPHFCKDVESLIHELARRNS